jgi:hypothetical protein
MDPTRTPSRLGLDIPNSKYNRRPMESGLGLPIPSSKYNRRPTPKEPRLGHEAWVNAGRTPNTSSTCLGFGACPKPNMLGSRQRVWTHFSPLMSLSPTLAKYFFLDPMQVH